MKYKGTRWYELSLKNLPEKPGVYVLEIDQKYLYIGSTENLRRRLQGLKPNKYSFMDQGFHTVWGVCQSITAKAKIPSRVGDWLMDEYRLIKRLKPVLNSTGSTRRRWDTRCSLGVPQQEVRYGSGTRSNRPASVDHFVADIRRVDA